MKIVITPRGFAKFGLEYAQIMNNQGFDVDYNDTGLQYDRQTLLDKCKDADGVIIGVESIDKDFIDNCPNLKAIVKFGVGTDNIDIEYANSKNIKVGKTVNSNSRSVAEGVIAYIMSDSINLIRSVNETKQFKWNKLTGYEVLGKKLGIIGFGAIGKHVATMANGLGINVLAYDPYTQDEKVYEEYNVKPSDFNQILKECDFISLHCPLTDSTRNLISLNEIKMMKSTSILINTSRGGVVNENDLYEALSSNLIRAAYFDVFSCEPINKDEKLLSLDNFYLTPHIASRTNEAELNTVRISTEVIMDYLKH